MFLFGALNELASSLEGFILIFLRVSAFMLAAPFFGAASVSVRIRVLLAGLISWFMLPLVEVPAGLELVSLSGLLSVGMQLLLGLALGFSVQLVFAALVLGGQVMAMSMGLGFALSVDPQNGAQTPVISQFYLIFGTLIFLSLDLHLVLLDYLLNSYFLLPLDGSNFNLLSLPAIVGWGSEMFAGALLLAMPMMAAILMVNLALGVMTRAAPQLNIFAVGFPITLALGFVFILLSIPSITPLLEGWFTSVLSVVNQLIHI